MMRAIRPSPAARRALVALCIVGICTAGCSPTARRRLRSILFTGVPSSAEKAAVAEDAKNEAGPTAASRRVRSPRQRASDFWVHGPYGSGDCGRCHALNDSTRFRSFGTSIGQGGKGMTAASRLIDSPRKLCLSCHATHTDAAADARNLWLHAPVASGRCIACHSPHQSRRPFMLLGENNASLCRGCHDDSCASARHAPPGPSEVDCLECHNPHIGSTSLMLRAEYDEQERFYD